MFKVASLLFVSISWFFLFCTNVAEARNVTKIDIGELRMDPSDEFHVAVETTFAGAGFVDLAQAGFTVSPLNRNEFDWSADLVSTYIDIVLVKLPDDCFTNQRGADCDWSKNMGVGYYDEPNNNGPWYCCSQEALDAGGCTEDKKGRFILNDNLFTGTARNITVPASLAEDAQELTNGEMVLHLEDPPGMMIQEAGTYAILMANCDSENGRTIIVDGETDWDSYEETIQTFVEENVPFYLILSIFYAVLSIWFGLLMRKNRESRIRLEEWIMTVILLGLCDVLFQLLRYSVLEKRDSNSGMDVFARVLLVFGALINGIKHGLSRFLLLMLSLGLGVVHPTLDPTTTALITTMTIAFVLFKAMSEILVAFGVGPTDPSYTFIEWSFWADVLIDIIFMVWIPLALCSTMKYLKTSGQLRKLERYRSLAYILAFAIALTLLEFVLIWLDNKLDDGQEISILNLSQGNELNFFVILTCVAVLWKPNPMAQDFVYAMELSSQDGEYSNEGPLGMGGREGYLADLELSENARNEMAAHSSSDHSLGDRSSVTDDSTDYNLTI